MKRILTVGIAFLAFTALRADAYDWAGLFNWLTTTSTTTENQVSTVQSEALTTLNNIQAQANAIDTTVQENFLNIVSLLSTKKETKSIKSQINTILDDKNKTDEERSVLINQILNAYASSLSTNSNTTSVLKKLSASEKIELIKDITSIEQSAQKYASLAKQAVTVSAGNLLKSSANSAASADDVAAIIKQTNETASLIKDKASATVNFVNQLNSVLKTSGLKQ